MQNTSHRNNNSALLSNQGGMTSFRYGDQHIRFRSSSKLEQYVEIKEWDKGYMVVTAKYRDLGEVEEYIDLIPILRNLHIDPEKFLQPIQTVKIVYDEPQ